MHGLRCTPGLLGWTRLLDEWVVGLTRYNVAEGEPVCWAEAGATTDTLAHAATRVRTFIGRDTSVEPTLPNDDGTLQFELQGVPYIVGVGRHEVTEPVVIAQSGATWLTEAVQRAQAAASAGTGVATSAQPGVVPVGAVFVIPRLSSHTARPADFAEQYVVQSRVPGCDGAAYSFPGPGERDRYHYANDVYPGALVLVKAGDSGATISV